MIKQNSANQSGALPVQIGACSMHTCWHRLPPFRDVANKLHDSLDKAFRVEMYVAPHGNSLATNRHKSLTSASMKKSNKKRSSSLQQPANLLSGLGRSSTPAAATLFTTTTTPSHLGDTSMENGGRLQAHHELLMNSINSNSNSISGSAGAGAGTGGGVNDLPGTGGIDKQSSSSSSEFAQQNTIQYASLLTAQQTNTTSPVRKRPIARSIGPAASTLTLTKLDLVYAEESPDFCVPSERYNIKGTKGRICSEDRHAANSCETLCCGRGYKTDRREEKYTCECEFQFCCILKCNTCSRRKDISKCL